MDYSIKALSASDVRALVRRHAKLLAPIYVRIQNTASRDYMDLVAAVARLLVEHAPVFCDIVLLGTDASDEQVQAMGWIEVVRLAVAVIQVSAEAWRPAWSSGFGDKILREELSAFLKPAGEVAGQ